MIENLANDDVLILKNCLLQSISSNNKYAQDSLQNAINDLSGFGFADYEDRVKRLNNIALDLNAHIKHIEQLIALLEKFRDS